MTNVYSVDEAYAEFENQLRSRNKSTNMTYINENRVVKGELLRNLFPPKDEEFPDQWLFHWLSKNGIPTKEPPMCSIIDPKTKTDYFIVALIPKKHFKSSNYKQHCILAASDSAFQRLKQGNQEKKALWFWIPRAKTIEFNGA